MYVDAVRTKRLPNPGTSSFDTLEAAQKDPLIIAKRHFYMSVIRSFKPFLTTYQTDQPMMPFLVNDLADLMKCILWHFIKREVLLDISPLQLARIDVGDKRNWVHPKEVNSGFGAESTLKELQRQEKTGELRALEFKRDCIKVMSTILQKVQDKSPLKYPTVRQLACLDPRKMFSDPEWCQGKMRNLVQRFLHDKQLSGGVSAGMRG
ncbi:uncharacterized protein LOC121912386 [Thunnus maccoyii]|uniref:uncharacterized protein LOC121912386 n=1 Tax=Thunnus maccoyii TaxID=8240 RepID=UPI001C4B29EE|nr:uncharacterized protein LOC121912386 [Thunnus maccoyii]